MQLSLCTGRKRMLPSNSNTEYQINLTQAAFKQILLISENDYTLSNKLFRLKIGGKGCDGFTYETGFSDKLNDDICLEYHLDHDCVTIILDTFTAYYCKEGQLDFLLNPKNNEDGFIFLNDNEHKYAGKFFRDESLVPDKSSTPTD